jgi:TRAP-type C4-dicarboxylate transport system substrate-binding protein
MQRMRALAALVAIAVLGGCAASVDKLGEPADTTLRLSGLSAQGRDEVGPFASAVERLSGGHVRVDIAVASPAADLEGGIVDQVRSGSADIGFAGARVWPAKGSHAYDALLAPLLIDSYALEGEVLTSGLIDAMTANLDADGITGLGVLPGPLRYMAGRRGPLRSPDDFSGLTIGGADAVIPQQVLRALGATGAPIPADGGLQGLDGVEGQISALVGNSYLSSMPFVASNLPMWPRAISVFMNSGTFEALTDQQRTWLKDAAAAATPESIAGLVRRDDEFRGVACRTGVRFEAASPEDRAAVEAALRPVTDDLRAQAATAESMDAIAALKSGTVTSLSCEPDTEPSHASEAAATAVDGRWTACPTVDQIVAAGGSAGEADGNAGCVTLTFDRGVFRESGASAAREGRGSYSVDGDQVAIERANGERFGFTFGFFRDQLILSRPADQDRLTPAPWRAVSFTREGR